MDQRNLLIAIVASMAILLGFQFLYEQPRQRAAQERAAQQQAANPPATPEPGASTPGTATPGATTPGTTTPGGTGDVVIPGSGPAAAAATPAAAERRIAVQAEGMHGSISLTGGRIDDITLPRYRETIDPNSPEIRLLSQRGKPDAYFALFGWMATDSTVPVPGQETVWSSQASTLDSKAPVDLTWDNGQGLKFTQTMGVDKDSMFTVKRTVRNDSGKAVTLQPWALVSRLGTPHNSGTYILFEGPIGVVKGVLREHGYDKLKEQGRIQEASTGGWFGITDKYWLVALLPDQKREVKSTFSHSLSGTADRYQVDWLGNGLTIEPGQSIETTDHLFVGAKRVELLKRYQEDLSVVDFDKAVDWGWFHFLTRPIFWLLEQLYHLLGNFGLAILALTVLVKLAFFPLANKSYRAMSQMKKLQPMMQELKERYGDDRQKMNEEMMALYRREKINPAAGCLPIVVQIPVFFSLYKVLFVTIEMRHAPFFGWIRDLSAPDPTHLLNLFGLIPWDPPMFLHLGAWPIIMGITMFLQMRLNPQPTDPIQAKVFMFMPIIFTIMLKDFSSGLVIYWAWNNLLSIAQQWMIMRRAGVVTPKPAAPAAKAK